VPTTLEVPTVEPAVFAGSLNAGQVQTGAPNGPGIWIAPAGQAPPLDCKTAYATPWQILGYTSDDGPTVGTDLTPWQSQVPLRTIITSRKITLQFVLWQLNEQTLALYFDQDMPTPTAGGEIDLDVKSSPPQHPYAISIDSKDGNQAFRVTFSKATLSDAGDMQITRGAVVPLDCTLSALDVNGTLAKVQYGPAT
jgi:hypothetical protein